MTGIWTTSQWLPLLNQRPSRRGENQTERERPDLPPRSNRAAAIELLPGLAELVIDELSAGLRPGTPDNAPLIGADTLRRLITRRRAADRQAL